MKRYLNLLAVVVIAVMLAVQGAAAQNSTPESTGNGADLQAATDWLVSQQQDDGGFPGFSGESDPSITIDSILALVAADYQGIDTGDAVDAAVAYLESGDIALVFAQTGQGQAAKLVLGVTATGGDPQEVSGVDALSLIEREPSADTGLYGTGVFDHAYVILAQAAAGAEVPVAAIEALESTQTAEGGWAFDGTTAEGAADSNTTALVVQALLAADEGGSPLVEDALAYLETTIDGSNGAVFQPAGGTPPDSSSTAFVIQALIAAGEDPTSDSWGNLPAALAGFQNEGGAFHFNVDDMTDNIFSTVQAIPAMAGVALPVAPSGESATLVASLVALRTDNVVVLAA